MATAADVRNYIAAHTPTCGDAQLRHLLYHAQGWHLAWEGRPLFADPITASPDGPAFPTLAAGGPQPDPHALGGPEQVTVDAVLHHYLPARHTPGSESGHTCHVDVDTMRAHYIRLALAGHAPTRRPAASEAEHADVAAAASAAAIRWRETLTLLSA